MSTLVVDLDERVRKSPRFKGTTVAEYFKNADLAWWRELSRRKAYREQEQVIKSWLGGISLGRVIELGPGLGRITKILVQHGSEKGLAKYLTLVEINERATRKLKKDFPGAEIVQADISASSWESWDLPQCGTVVAMEVLVHIPDIPQLLANIAKVLVAGGLALISITPAGWYKRNYARGTVMHRGVDVDELEAGLSGNFMVANKHTTKNGQLITYLLKKQGQQTD